MINSVAGIAVASEGAVNGQGHGGACDISHAPVLNRWAYDEMPTAAAVSQNGGKGWESVVMDEAALGDFNADMHIPDCIADLIRAVGRLPRRQAARETNDILAFDNGVLQ